MYPSLYHFFYDNFGLDINGLKAIKSFGFFVAIAFLAGATLLTRELKRLEKEGFVKSEMRKKTIGKPLPIYDLIFNALLGFFLGYKLVYAFMHSEVFEDFPGFLFSNQGHFISGIIGALIMGYWRFREGKKEELPEPKIIDEEFHPYNHVGAIVGISAIFGFIGARLFAWLEDPVPLTEFFKDPFSGFTVYGGMIVGVLAGTYYLKRNNLPILRFYDAVSPALIMSYGIGRIGCHIAGDGDWGIVNNHPKPSFLPNWLWAYRYPNNVNTEGDPISNCIYNDEYCTILPQAHYPTPLYETLMCLVIFSVLWYYRKKIKTAGILFFMYVGFSGIERLLIEQIRVNSKYDFGGIQFTQAELISVIMIISGIAGIFILLRKNKNSSIDASNSSS